MPRAPIILIYNAEHTFVLHRKLEVMSHHSDSLITSKRFPRTQGQSQPHRHRHPRQRGLVSIGHLPDKALILIFKLLYVAEHRCPTAAHRVSQVCRLWRNLASTSDSCRELWNNIVVFTDIQPPGITGKRETAATEERKIAPTRDARHTMQGLFAFALNKFRELSRRQDNLIPLSISFEMFHPNNSNWDEEEDEINSERVVVARCIQRLVKSGLSNNLVSLTIKTASIAPIHDFCISYSDTEIQSFPSLFSLKMFARDHRVKSKNQRSYGVGYNNKIRLRCTRVNKLVVSLSSFALDLKCNVLFYGFPDVKFLTVNDYGKKWAAFSPIQLLDQLAGLRKLVCFTLEGSKLWEQFEPSWNPTEIYECQASRQVAEPVLLPELVTLHFGRIPPGFIYSFVKNMKAPNLIQIVFEGAPDDREYQQQIFEHLERFHEDRFPKLSVLRFFGFHASLIPKIARFMSYVRTLCLEEELHVRSTPRSTSRSWPFNILAHRQNHIGGFTSWHMPNLTYLILDEQTMPDLDVLISLALARKTATRRREEVCPIVQIDFIRVWSGGTLEERSQQKRLQDVVPLVRWDQPKLGIDTQYPFEEAGRGQRYLREPLPFYWRKPKVYDDLENHVVSEPLPSMFMRKLRLL
ncbi:hypothetical protein BXZ70DRAFT_2881 [Cristinia sonorae]|uniref:F-box domain-containing protein n=1 Tax=Cristinia sonorae TaxID=1940300 RepID=A0A8K0UZA7_9AGAR|nr:hypothetical protein BXZ70DRAFT_2881 [Cristinia sonorae]